MKTEGRAGSITAAMIFLFVVAIVIPVVMFDQAFAETNGSPFAPKNASERAFQAAAIANYWTPERMAEAKPYPMPKIYIRPGELQPAAASLPPGPPGYQPGYNPKDKNSMNYIYPQTLDQSADTVLSRSLAGSSSLTPASVSYPSVHTTFEYQGGYRVFPAAPIGKLFFTQNGGNYVCSASLIGYKYVVTAGHCLHDGSNSPDGYSTNVNFCPSYDISQGGANPVTGCWATNDVHTTPLWYSSAEPDADIGMAFFGSSGTKISNYPGYAVGWLGYAWNYSIGQSIMMFGYPSADRAETANNEYADFNGGKIYVTAAEEAGYTMNWGSWANSKFIGTTQTPGTSGGPWVVRWGKKYINTWNGNYVNGVNSHLRCYDSGCTDLYREVSSPQFIRNTGACGGGGTVDFIQCVMSGHP
jgi:hypothetical protein